MIRNIGSSVLFILVTAVAFIGCSKDTANYKEYKQWVTTSLSDHENIYFTNDFGERIFPMNIGSFSEIKENARYILCYKDIEGGRYEDGSYYTKDIEIISATEIPIADLIVLNSPVDTIVSEPLIIADTNIMSISGNLFTLELSFLGDNVDNHKIDLYERENTNPYNQLVRDFYIVHKVLNNDFISSKIEQVRAFRLTYLSLDITEKIRIHWTAEDLSLKTREINL